MNDIPPTLQERLKPLFFKKDVYSDKLCANGKEIRRIRFELMKDSEISDDVLRRSQRLIEETTYLTTKLRALEREIDGVLTQEILVMAGSSEGRPQPSKPKVCAWACNSEGRPQLRRVGCEADDLSQANQRFATKPKVCDQVFEGNLRVEGEKAEG
ncbi:MAG: hypothetical protein PHG64_13805 [Paludibacter sp.]|nr:hypothetical protein [Paludibacter sp.]